MSTTNFKDFEQMSKDDIFENTVKLYNQFKYKNFAAGLNKKEFKNRLSESNSGLLTNVPFGFKDNVSVEGFIISLSSKLFQNNLVNHDSEVIKNLKSEGGVPFTNLSMHNLAYGTTGDRSVNGPIHNYQDDELMAGGSSSGSAVAVALGIVPMAVGSDTSGSIRIPAAYADVVGFKPAYNDLSLDGVYPLSKSLDHVGPIANNVKNTYISYKIMQGNHPEPLLVNEESLTKSTRILVPDVEKLFNFEEGILENFLKVINLLKEKGFTVEESGLPHLDEIMDYQKTILRFETYELYKDKLHKKELFDEEVYERLEAGKEVKKEDYQHALDKRETLLKVYEEMVGDNVLLLPTMLIYPKKLQEREVSLEGFGHIRDCMFNLTAPFNYLPMPVLSLPTNFKGENYNSIQLIGKEGNEVKLFELGKVVENEFSKL